MRRFDDFVPWSVLTATGLFLLIVLTWWAVHDHINLPTVYTSWTTKECVKIEGCDCDCSTPPGRAHTVWVK